MSDNSDGLSLCVSRPRPGTMLKKSHPHSLLPFQRSCHAKQLLQYNYSLLPYFPNLHVVTYYSALRTVLFTAFLILYLTQSFPSNTESNARTHVICIVGGTVFAGYQRICTTQVLKWKFVCSGLNTFELNEQNDAEHNLKH